MVRSIIIDDEKRSRDTLSELLRIYCPNVEVIGAADSAHTGVDAIRRHRPDVIFLDVAMPRASGFDLLEDIADVPCDVIFTTAYNEYAIRAIRTGAIDYLLKPIAEDDLVAAVERVETKRAVPPAAVPEEPVRPASQPAAPIERLALPTLEGLIFVQIRDIIHCQSSDNYTIIHLANGERVIVARTLKEYDDLLSGMGFFRVHNSHLVNLVYVRKYVKGEGGYIVMADNSQIEVSRRRKDDLLHRLSGC